MSHPVLGLAGVLQGAALVHRIAHAGGADAAALEASLGSVFCLEPADAAGVFGGVAGVRLGLEVLLRQLEGPQREPALTRIAATVLHVERRLARRPPLQALIRAGVEEAERQRLHLGASHPAVMARLAQLYAGTISQLRPRVLVQGNPQYLAQETVVAEIRAVLLAAVRAAVLWRQLGGGYADLLLRRRGLALAARRLLAEAGSTDGGDDGR